MQLSKAYIEALDAKDNPKGEKVEVMFNPVEYSIETSNQFQSTAILGLSTPLTQFVNGNARTLAMDLFFDTYEQCSSVVERTRRITDLLEIDADLHAPPRVRFTWKDLRFKATIEKVTQKFTMFLSDGTPVRSTLNVTFKEYRTLAEQLQSPRRQSSDRTKVRIVTQGDSLWLIANREYGAPSFWRRIAEANDIEDPLVVEAGRELAIPPLD
jgi:hypothetical protein